MSGVRAAFRLLALSALLSGAAGADDGDMGMERVLAACPGVASYIREHEQSAASQDLEKHPESATSTAVVTPPTDPALRESLLEMERVDQEARIGNLADPIVVKRMNAVDAVNLPRLRAFVAAGGFPSVQQVGRDGFNAAWLLVQHADADPAFQQQVLESLIASKQIGGEQLAMLTDHVLRAQGKPQRYGSQFFLKDGQATVQPIEAPADAVDARRAAMGMMPMADYTCFVRTMQAAPKR